MNKIKAFIFSSLTILTLGLFGTGLAPNVDAQSDAKSQGNGIKISPVRTDLVINKGETKIMTINLQNVTGAEATFKAIINDFVAGKDEKGQPALILDDNEYAPTRSLKKHILDIPNVTLKANETKEIKVSISIPSNATAGGYFGAVRFALASSDGGQSVTLSASVGSIILVKVPGEIKEKMDINSFDVRRGAEGVGGSALFTTNKDLYAVVRFKNYGDVHEQPFGKIEVKQGKKLVQSIEINNTDPKGNVLPDSIRRFNVKLDKIGSFGKYTVIGNFGYGENGQLLSATTSFWVIPIALVVGVIVAIILVLALIIGLPKAIGRYNRNILRKAGRR